MNMQQIQDAIAEQLQGDDHEYWVGMSRQDREEIACEVHAGNATIEQAADTIRSWAYEAQHCVDSN